jgi:hypothetical protein
MNQWLMVKIGSPFASAGMYLTRFWKAINKRALSINDINHKNK